MNTTGVSSTWNRSLWVAQVLLASLFGVAGAMKVLELEAFSVGMGWGATVAPSMLRFIGSMELLGVIGLIAPGVTRIAPALTPLAGAGLATLMILASLFHGYRHEPANIAVNFTIGLVAVFVAWGRIEKAPLGSRTNRHAARA